LICRWSDRSLVRKVKTSVWGGAFDPGSILALNFLGKKKRFCFDVIRNSETVQAIINICLSFISIKLVSMISSSMNFKRLSKKKRRLRI